MAAPYDDLFVSFQSAVAGRYSLERELGRGGMGIVYLAREVRLDRPVALKLFPPALAAQPTLRERFLREARTAARLSHPHIVPIFAVDEVDPYVFFAMAYVQGETLGTRVRERGPLAPSEAARVLREVAWALSHAHEQGVIHRDVKPDNILLEAATGRALVADFGIAGLQHDAGSQVTGEVIGTPEFMSPEQASGQHADAASDIYALGAVAFYAMAGRAPFGGTTSAAILAKHMTQPAPPLAEAAPAVPRRVAHIVDACLAKDPAERPRDAAALAEQLALTLEQRKDLPVALRAFVKHDGRLDGPGFLLYPSAVLLGSTIAGAAGGVEVGFGMLAAGVVLVPLGTLAARARRLVKSGFEHADVAPAFKTEIERGREERAFRVNPRPSWVERVAKVAGLGGLAGATLGVVVATIDPSRWVSHSALAFVLLAGSGGLLSTIGYLSLLQRRRDIDTEFWSKLWTGPLGRVLFRVGRWWLPERAISQAMTHRPTELAIAMAAEQLFAALPKPARRELGDLPAVVHRLEADAQRMRARLDALHDAVAGTSRDASGARSATVAGALRAERDTLQRQLADTVAALENIRLGLLKLSSGVGSVQSLTTDLAAARAVGEAVDLLLEGQREAEAVLAPRAVTAQAAPLPPREPARDGDGSPG